MIFAIVKCYWEPLKGCNHLPAGTSPVEKNSPGQMKGHNLIAVGLRSDHTQRSQAGVVLLI